MDEEESAGAEVAEEGGGEGARQVVAGDLEVLLHEVGGRPARRKEVERRTDEEADAMMDNGIRINPYFRGRARPGGAEEEEAAARGGAGPRCQAGHCMHRRETDASGLTCDGGCGRWLWRGARVGLRRMRFRRVRRLRRGRGRRRRGWADPGYMIHADDI